MWPFASPSVEAEAAPQPGQTPEQRYVETLLTLATRARRLGEASKAISLYKSQHHDLRTARLDGHPAIAVGAMSMYAELQRLERTWREELQQFDLANRENALAKKAAGQASY